MSENIGIKLHGGPDLLNGWNNVYDGNQFGGWPPPERIAAFPVTIDAHGGAESYEVVAVALPENVPESYEDKVTLYRKVQQSKLLEADPEGVIVRGAVYEVEMSERAGDLARRLRSGEEKI